MFQVTTVEELKQYKNVSLLVVFILITSTIWCTIGLFPKPTRDLRHDSEDLRHFYSAALTNITIVWFIFSLIVIRAVYLTLSGRC